MANESDPVNVPAVKPEAPATVENAASAVTSAVDAVAKTGWMTSKAKIGMVVGGSLLTIVGGAFGIKSIGSGSPRAVAQQQSAEQKKTGETPFKSEFEEPKKLPANLKNDSDSDLPPVAPPVIHPVKGDEGKTKKPAGNPIDIDIPDLKAPPSSPSGSTPIVDVPDLKPVPGIGTNPAKKDPVELQSINKNSTVKPIETTIIRVGAVDNKDKSETSPPPKSPVDIDIPLIVSPPTVGGAPAAPKTGSGAPGKSDIELLPPPPPISGGTPNIADPKSPALGNKPPVNLPSTLPASPKEINIDPPPFKPADSNLPKSPSIPDLKSPSVPEVKSPGVPDPKVPNVPDLKSPGLTDPKIPSVPDVKTPGVTDPKIPSVPDLNVPSQIDPKNTIAQPPSATPDTRIKSPMIGVPTREPGIVPEPTPKPPVDAPKRDEYDEDWHTPRPTENYAMISKEYYKTADYAQALEAYNKDRRKGNDPYVRVPPVWVLEEKFSDLIGTVKTASKTAAGATGRTTGLNFEPVESKSIGTNVPPSRPVPSSPINTVANVNDEYRVHAEAGETIREIARKVYGDPNAWKRIYDSNPSIDPTQPIPSGTTLRLPR